MDIGWINGNSGETVAVKIVSSFITICSIVVPNSKHFECFSQSGAIVFKEGSKATVFAASALCRFSKKFSHNIHFKPLSYIEKPDH